MLVPREITQRFTEQIKARSAVAVLTDRQRVRLGEVVELVPGDAHVVGFDQDVVAVVDELRHVDSVILRDLQPIGVVGVRRDRAVRMLHLHQPVLQIPSVGRHVTVGLLNRQLVPIGIISIRANPRTSFTRQLLISPLKQFLYLFPQTCLIEFICFTILIFVVQINDTED